MCFVNLSTYVLEYGSVEEEHFGQAVELVLRGDGCEAHHANHWNNTSSFFNHKLHIIAAEYHMRFRFFMKRYNFILVLANSLISIKDLCLYACILLSGFFVCHTGSFVHFLKMVVAGNSMRGSAFALFVLCFIISFDSLLCLFTLLRLVHIERAALHVRWLHGRVRRFRQAKRSLQRIHFC